MSRAIIYTRVSTDQQEANSDSLDAQERDCRADCDKCGDEVVGVLSDTFSGRNSLDNRPGMQAAIERIRRGEADLLVVKRVSRVARDIADAVTILRDVSDASGALRSTVEGTFSGSQDDMLIMVIHAFQAAKDWETIRQQSRGGLENRVARGRPLVGVPLFGYRFEDGERGEKYRTKSVVVEDPESAPVVRAIFEKATEGWSIRRITGYLNEIGATTPSLLSRSRGELGRRKLSTVWTPEMVRNIVWNQSYTGRHAAYRNQAVLVKKNGAKPAYRMRKRAPEEAVSITIPALIDDATWHAVCKNRQQRDVLTADPPLLNQGFAVCGVCGSRMITAKQSCPRQYRIYRCRQAITHQCPGVHFVVKAETADREVWAKVVAIIRDKPRYERLVKSKSARLEEQHQEAARKAEAAERKLAEWQEKQAADFQHMNDEPDSGIRAMYRTELLHVNETVNQLKKRVQAARSVVESAQGERDTHIDLIDRLRYYAARYKADPAHQVRLQEELAKVGIDPSLHMVVMEQMPAAMDDANLYSLGREEKRQIMREMGLEVRMYPKNYVDSMGIRHERCELWWGEEEEEEPEDEEAHVDGKLSSRRSAGRRVAGSRVYR